MPSMVDLRLPDATVVVSPSSLPEEGTNQGDAAEGLAQKEPAVAPADDGPPVPVEPRLPADGREEGVEALGVSPDAKPPLMVPLPLPVVPAGVVAAAVPIRPEGGEGGVGKPLRGSASGPRARLGHRRQTTIGSATHRRDNGRGDAVGVLHDPGGRARNTDEAGGWA